MGPRRAAQMFLDRLKDKLPFARFEVTLYGSLAATGRGHMTDVAVLSILKPVAPTTILWEPKIFLPFHPNGMLFRAFDAEGKELDNWTIFSIGGGTLANEEYNEQKTVEVYEMSKIRDIQHWCESTGHSYWEYVEECEGAEIWDYLAEVWDVMQEAVRRGLEAEGILPGGLGIRRKASDYMIRAKGYGSSIKSRGLVYAYALAVSEENACGGRIVTAPTCGSCGVLPAVLYHLKETREFRDSRILRALATAGLFGNVVRTNASISGADVGCQGEVGVACSMAAGALAAVLGANPRQVENAAEIGMEHCLGLTCDPVAGQVQIPCIERNAVAAVKAVNAARLALAGDGSHFVSLDAVMQTMFETGKDMQSKYRETSRGGLAVNIVEC